MLKPPTNPGCTTATLHHSSTVVVSATATGTTRQFDAAKYHLNAALQMMISSHGVNDLDIALAYFRL
eukprot:scaffold2458_cov191-Alexandrium_tamarense.AAC.1